MGVDYGVSHMAIPIVFSYQHGNIHCMSDLDTPGQRVKALRHALELTQKQLADEAEIDQSTLSDIERGKGFSADILMRLSDALATSPQFIMRGQELNHTDLLAQIKALVEPATPPKQVVTDVADTPKNPGLPGATAQTKPPILTRHINKASQLPAAVREKMTSHGGVSRESSKPARKKAPGGGRVP